MNMNFAHFADDLESEFGASPLGKVGSRGGAAITALAETTGGLQANIDAAALPDIYGDLYGDTGEGNVLLITQLAQVRERI
jgi:predicted HD phosphohydrolase